MNLDTRIQFMTGVGPKIAKKLERLGIETFGDLIFYYPRTYIDFSNITKINEITKIQETRNKQIQNPNNQNSSTVTIQGKILGIANKKTSRQQFTVTEAVVEDGTGSLKVIWFNQPFLIKMFRVGSELILNGKISFNFYSREVVMESPQRERKLCIVPVYPETAGISSRFINGLISKSKFLIPNVAEYFPIEILKKYDLLGIQDALLNVHNPKNSEMLEKAKRRLAFDELFMIALRANLSKEELKKENAPKIAIAEEKIAEFVKKLPFELTGDQKKSAWQIIKDMSQNKPMNRLLNGDVGSGKTVVAAIAAFVAIRAGFSVAVMAPTSILANQHFETFRKLFPEELIGLMTSSKKEFSDKTKIFIGTHALIQKNVVIPDLGLVVVDEQHRFGVAQRSALRKLGRNKIQETITKKISNSENSKLRTDNCELITAQEVRPHFLSMTATPIPRTLHLALFGDLDVSIIKEKPKDRKEIKTRFVESHNREKAYQFIRAHIQSGRQAFVICPLIEDSSKGLVASSKGLVASSKENKEINSTTNSHTTNYMLHTTSLFEDERKTVKREYEKLQKIFPEFKIGMLHGKMPSKVGSASGGKSKDEVMAEFSNGNIDILVSTSVVEVGVDIPNASVMIIEDAERFGLAQIHQFRGRVGRAEHQSFCFLFSSTQSPKARSRLESLEATSDGFKLAEIDLETRGPGAVFGTEQSGLLDLKMASFSDGILIGEASSAAKSIVESDPELANHPLIKEKISDYLQNKHLE